MEHRPEVDEQSHFPNLHYPNRVRLRLRISEVHALRSGRQQERKELARTRVDFEFTAHVFDFEIEEFVDDREDDRELCIIAFGHIGGDMYAVVYTDRDDVRWISSSFRCREKKLRRWKRRAAAR